MSPKYNRDTNSLKLPHCKWLNPIHTTGYTGTSVPTRQFMAGIYVNQSPRSDVDCNTITNIGECFVWESTSHSYTVNSSWWQNNNLDYSKYGLVLRNAGVMGDQGTSCPLCGRNLTGSASKGRRGDKFFYYHCSNGCKERRKAEDLNALVLEMMKKFRSNPRSLDLYGDLLKKQLRTSSGENITEAERVSKDIDKNKQRLKNAQVLILDGEINPTEYKEMKIKLEEDLIRLTAEEIKVQGNKGNYEKHIDICVWIMKNLDRFYDAADTATKQRIIGSIFDEKLILEENHCRTTLINEVAVRICRKDSASGDTKKRKHTFSDVLSCQMEATDEKSNRLHLGIERLVNLNSYLPMP